MSQTEAEDLLNIFTKFQCKLAVADFLCIHLHVFAWTAGRLAKRIVFSLFSTSNSCIYNLKLVTKNR